MGRGVGSSKERGKFRKAGLGLRLYIFLGGPQHPPFPKRLHPCKAGRGAPGEMSPLCHLPPEWDVGTSPASSSPPPFPHLT